MTVKDTTIQPRVTFISLVDLYQSFRRISGHILFSSLFILKIRREWLYGAPNDAQNVLHTLQYDKDEEFMMLLKLKDSQGLLLFMNRSNEPHNRPPTPFHAHHVHVSDMEDTDELPLDFGIESDTEDDMDTDDDDDHFIPRLQRNESHYCAPVLRDDNDGGDDRFEEHDIHAMWMQLSHQLSSIYDPYEGTNYMPLLLNPKWWLNSFEESQFGASSKDILQEIYECEMNYRCVMEILFQSNPSLIPCKNYRELEDLSTHGFGIKPRPKKVELSEINAMSNGYLDVLDPSMDISTKSVDWTVDYDLDLMLHL
eukprot:325261_1